MRTYSKQRSVWLSQSIFLAGKTVLWQGLDCVAGAILILMFERLKFYFEIRSPLVNFD